ncbi:MAG TPA: hypothetical protein VGH83_00005, partial [Candidatus Acidoferrum sp.]
MGPGRGSGEKVFPDFFHRAHLADARELIHEALPRRFLAAALRSPAHDWDHALVHDLDHGLVRDSDHDWGPISHRDLNDQFDQFDHWARLIHDLVRDLV